MRYVPSREAAKVLGVHANTLRKWADTDKIEYIKSASGQRRYNVDSYLGITQPSTTVCYCRVSSYKQKDDLQRQVDFMHDRFHAAEVVKDMNRNRILIITR